MNPTPLFLFAIALLAASEAAAQQPPGGGNQPPCLNDFLSLRQEAEKRAAVVKAAGEHKASQPEICQAFKSFVAAEAKLVKFMEANNVWCGIPPEAVKQSKSNHAKTIKISNQICNAARAANTAPPPPSLSDALGTTRVPDASTTKTGRGTLDTLTGNPLAR